jgi:CubicO group peptidase (beta-lactamase class C family)
VKKWWIAALLVAAGAGFALYRLAAFVREPVTVDLSAGPPQPKVSPGEAGIDPVALEAAVTYAGARRTRALVVGRGGHIVYEKYWGDTTLETPVDLSGFAPVLVALSTGSLMNDRLISNLDAPVSNYIPEYSGTTTLRELLAQDGGRPTTEAANTLALVLERITKQSYDAIVVERLWKPLGNGSLSFVRGGGKQRSDGVDAGCCIRARLGDWMRIGVALANDGVFEGNQLTPPHYVNLMLKPAHKDAPLGFFTRVDGDFATHDVARLESDGKQRLWVVPSLQLVILRVGEEPPSSQGWDEAMIPDSIIRGTSGWKPKSAGEGVDPNKFAPH